ncbi:MAG TPA: hypothetical protein PKC43_02495 [Phycisphaerales bacterium]|nr:hypothetical protein [Phycisphaerales bacterium]HMP36295.1 hypothetical protein [Phycisphaerales bacterium]
MQCNIDRRGRVVRLLVGVVSLSAGVALAVLAAGGGVEPRWLLWVGVGAIAGGLFGIAEAWLGWCAARAMGMRTPL